jgi:DNA polymerase III subunit gamma/tau
VKEKYQIFARKYRPQAFKEVVGQTHIVTTLKNAIRLNRAASAYIFAGSRGTGKTTLARLLAKTLNCNNLSADIEPCNNCTSCKEITGGFSLDVIEIDGASNRGIDDIRQINDTIGYAPPSGKYKIYIIDEVHMLTKEAFNALLKTLEEPPPFIKFFFATTEPHKVLPTILSRCQRFDLCRIPHNLIVSKLKAIAEENKRGIEEEALHLIARFSEGSLRDAESLLDQLLCYEEEHITSLIVERYLGFVSKELFFELDVAIQEKRSSFAFELVDKIFQSGKDLSFFLEELIEHFRYIMLAKFSKNLFQLGDDLQKRYLQNSTLYTEEQGFFILEILLQSLRHLQKSSFKKASLEMILLEIIKSKERIPLPALVRRLIELEKFLGKSPNLNMTESSAPTKLTTSALSTEGHKDSQVLTNSIQEKVKPSAEAHEDSKIVTESSTQIKLATPELPPIPPPETDNNNLEKVHPPKEEGKIKEIVTPILEKPLSPIENFALEGIEDKKIELVIVPFSLDDENNSPKTTLCEKKDRSNYENLLRFASVELEGNLFLQ